MFDRQKAFDTMVLGLNEQKAVSVDHLGDLCMYRGTDGRKCAVGFLIPDEKYDREMEELVADDPVVLELIPDCDESHGIFLVQCQTQLHDRLPKNLGWDQSAFERSVKGLCILFNLTNPITEGE